MGEEQLREYRESWSYLRQEQQAVGWQKGGDKDGSRNLGTGASHRWAQGLLRHALMPSFIHFLIEHLLYAKHSGSISYHLAQMPPLPGSLP